MSKRKDRERFSTMKRLSADYVGFRGVNPKPTSPSQEALETATCSNCGRKRNVTAAVLLEYGESYICTTCTESMPEVL